MIHYAPTKEQIIVEVAIAIVATIISQGLVLNNSYIREVVQILANPPLVMKSEKQGQITITTKPNLQILPITLRQPIVPIHNSVISIQKAFDFTNRTTATTTSKSFSMYQNNSTLGIKIQYPSNWNHVPADGIGVVFISPPEGNSDRFLEKLTIAVFPSYKNASVNELANGAIDNYKGHFIDFQLVESKAITFKSNPAYTIVYIYTDQDHRKIMAMDLGSAKDNKVYVLSYSADPTEYSSDMPTIHKMIDSFETFPVELMYSSKI